MNEKNSKINRVIWIILDSVGMGELPDANLFDDVGTNTLVHIYEKNNGLNIPNLVKLGLGNIDGMRELDKISEPFGCYGRMAEISNGKDTTIGHWEMIGIHSKDRFPTYPFGFPDYIIDKFIELGNIPGILGNKVASGTEIIKEYYEEHMKTKKPIIYTSADSVFQIACHESIYPVERLYELCDIARKILVDKDKVARVIARPFTGNYENVERTSNRRDYSITPDKNNLLVNLKNNGYDVIGIGKIEDIFAKVGITEAVHTKDNNHGIDVTIEYLNKKNNGLIFTNLVEFDSKWGHRNDYKGYANGLEDFDRRLGDVINNMQEDDILIINADHGCDPTTKGTDHTREYVPLLVYGNHLKKGINLFTLSTFADVGQTICDIFQVGDLLIGTSFLNKIIK